MSLGTCFRWLTILGFQQPILLDVLRNTRRFTEGFRLPDQRFWLWMGGFLRESKVGIPSIAIDWRGDQSHDHQVRPCPFVDGNLTPFSS